MMFGSLFSFLSLTYSNTHTLVPLFQYLANYTDLTQFES